MDLHKAMLLPDWSGDMALFTNGAFEPSADQRPALAALVGAAPEIAGVRWRGGAVGPSEPGIPRFARDDRAGGSGDPPTREPAPWRSRAFALDSARWSPAAGARWRPLLEAPAGGRDRGAEAVQGVGG